MKNLRLIFAIGMMAVSTAVFAQSDDSEVTSYNRIEFSYNPVIIDDINSIMTLAGFPDKGYLYMNGFSGGYICGIRLFKSSPLFLETGFRLAYAWAEKDVKAEKVKFGTTSVQTFGAVIPVNFAYRFSDNGDFSLVPFVGITLKGNFLAELDYEGVDGGKSHTNLFDDIEDEEDPGLSMKHFQLGWNCGFNVNYKGLSLGLAYGRDITNMLYRTKSYEYRVSVGYTF